MVQTRRRTALDWRPQSRHAAFLTGGANTHVAHHLFPNVSHVHYREQAPIIRARTCKHGRIARETSFLCTIGSHLRFLRRLARGACSRGGVTLVYPRRRLR